MKALVDVSPNYEIAKDEEMIPPIETTEDEQKLLEAFNNTAQPYAADKTLADLFEQQVARTPQNIALYLEGQTMTYEELNKRANQLARHLIANGVKTGDNVGLIANRNFGMVIGLFAILKCGGAYVPVEPDYPADRQKYMLNRSSVKCVVTNLPEPPGDMGSSYTFVRCQDVNYDSYSCENLELEIDSHQLAYTIYTSGSTGLPKGVMIEHHSAVNLVTWVNSRFNVTEDDRLLFVTPICFDLSVYDIFGMLACGGGVVMADKVDVLNMPKLTEMLCQYKITFWNSVPTTMDYLVNRLGNTDPDYRQFCLRLVFLSGDWIPVPLPDKIKSYFPNATVVSLGGATEATVWSNYHIVEEVTPDMRSIPYGVPITNNSFYILDEQLKPVPVGETGELYIGGVGVARGYANDPEKTRNAFLPDPFTNKWGGRMYRTGDLGRMMPGMIMEFIGRKDSQVKIRGHRVELGEIETVIRQNASINNAVVLYHEDMQQLACYIVPGKYYDRDNLMALIKTKLPEYMLPNKWIELEHMPLTSNGKIDKKALKEYNKQEQLKREYVAPRNEMEKNIAEVWQEILGISQIGINDNFFDLGGQSLLAVELITEMERKISKELPVNMLYKYPTIAEVATFIQKEVVNKKWRSLVAIKSSGSKTPLYIVHGDGLSLSNFHNLGQYVDDDQPIYSFQPIGLNGADEPENIVDIARYYVEDILDHNPDGPYALAGYSFGGYVVIEMKKILEGMGKQVKMLAIFDTDAGNVIYKKDWLSTLPLRIKRQIPKFMFIAKSLFVSPLSTIHYQAALFSKKFNNLCIALGIKDKPELKGVNMRIDRINETHLKAFKKYQLTSFNDKIYLFKAKFRMYFVDDFEYLGWANYALQGVSVYEVPGDHKTMFYPPNVNELGRLLQHALDNC